MKKSLVLTMAILLGGCAATETASTASSTTETTQLTTQTEQFFEVHQHGRIYLFNDFTLYQDFLKMGHTAYVKSFIGEGPDGETLSFGLTGKQKKKLSGIKHVDLYMGAREAGEAALRFSDIGAGPQGETVVYVLNSTNKKQRPDALMATFKQLHAM